MSLSSSLESDDLAIWRRLLPAEVSVSCGSEARPAGSSPFGLTQRERLSLGPAGSRRVEEFSAGRYHARCALALMGIEAAELLRGDDGQPLWPTGVVGSIAHTVSGTRVFAVVAVARCSDIAALGIDIECRARLEPRFWPSLLLPKELAKVLALPVAARAAEVLVLWCAKEAVAKASGSVADVRRIVVQHPNGGDEFTATVDPDAPGAAQPRGDLWYGRVAVAPSRTFAAAVRRTGRE